jgi:hypothetical protein
LVVCWIFAIFKSGKLTRLLEDHTLSGFPRVRGYQETFGIFIFTNLISTDFRKF